MFSDLFWSLYLIEVVSNFSSVGAISLILSSLILAGIYLVRRGDLKLVDRISVYVKVFIIIFFTTITLCLVPSKPTMYMMLAVRTTDNFSKTEMGKKLEIFLNKEIDKLIGEVK